MALSPDFPDPILGALPSNPTRDSASGVTPLGLHPTPYQGIFLHKREPKLSPLQLTDWGSGELVSSPAGSGAALDTNEFVEFYRPQVASVWQIKRDFVPVT